MIISALLSDNTKFQVNMFKTLMFVGFLAVVMAAPAPAPAPAPVPGGAAVIASPYHASLGPALISNVGTPVVYSGYPASLSVAGYAPSAPYIYKSYVY